MKYFLIYEKRLVKGEQEDNGFFVKNAFEYTDGKWEKISSNEINDRLIGYDPSEDGIYGIGDEDIMDEIREISKTEAEAFLSGKNK